MTPPQWSFSFSRQSLRGFYVLLIIHVCSSMRQRLPSDLVSQSLSPAKQNWPTIGYSLTMAQLTKAGQSYLGKALNCWKTKQGQLCPHFHEWQLWKMLLQWSVQHWGMYPGAGLGYIRFTILLPPRQSPPQLLKGWAHSQALLTGYFCVHWVLSIAFFRSGWATSDQTFTGVLRIMSILWEVWRNGTGCKGWAFGYRMLPVRRASDAMICSWSSL